MVGPALDAKDKCSQDYNRIPHHFSGPPGNIRQRVAAFVVKHTKTPAESRYRDGALGEGTWEKVVASAMNHWNNLQAHVSGEWQ